MKAALDALANLSSNDNHTTSDTTNDADVEEDGSHTARTAKIGGGSSVAVGGIDARSVRVAIEQDALYQARLLEGELRKLVDRVQTLRGQIRGVADVASEVCRSIDGGVVLVTSARAGGGRVAGAGAGAGGMHGIDEGKEGDEGEEGDVPTTGDQTDATHNHNDASSSSNEIPSLSSTTTKNADTEQEQQLAALLANAFHEREEASKRFDAITIFMEKFDVSENDSYLLDQYTFDNVFQEGTSATAGSTDMTTPDDTNGPDASTTSSGVKDGMAFLDALQRVSKIRRELVTSFDVNATNTNTGDNDTNSTNALVASHLGATSAMHMMENLASKQERAYERLYHFLHNHLDLHSASVAHVPTSSNLSQPQYPHHPYPPHHHHTGEQDDEDDGMDVTLTHPFVRRSLSILRQKPAFYTHTLELIATVRRSEVTRKFLMALTSGYGGMAAMEMKAHDPVNYVGDMLAFVFRTLSVESVLSLGLASVDDTDGADGGGVVGEEERGEEDMDVIQPMSAVDVLNDTMSGVARPLRSRIAQVVGALACRQEDYDDDHSNNDNGNNDGWSDGQNVPIHGSAGGSGNALEEEASSARVRLASIYSVCGLLLYYHSAIKKAVNKLQPKKKSANSDHNDDGVDGDDDDYDDDADDLSKDNPIVRCLIECIQEATQAYVASLKVHNALLPHYASTSNTTPAEIAHSAIVRLCNVRTASPGFDDGIITSISSSVARSSTQSGTTSASSISHHLSLEYLCDTIVEEVLSSIGTTNERSARLQIDDVGSVKTAIAVAKKSGLDAEVGAKWDAVIKGREEVIVEELIVGDTSDALGECGLRSIQRALEGMKMVYIEGMTMASQPGLSREAVERAMKTFYGSLYDPPFPSYEGIKDPVLRKYARTKLVKNVGDVYEEIYDTFTGDAHKGDYGDLTFLEHTPKSVTTLLSS